MRHLALPLLLAICSPALAAPPATAPDPASAPILALLDRLSGSDFATRQAAQKDLDKLDYHALAPLRQIAAATADNEIKTRLLARADSLAEELAANPPPITVAFANAHYDDVAAALQSATGAPVEARAFTGRTFVVDRTDTPFWEIFRDISNLDAVSIERTTRGILLANNPQHPTRDFTVAGPFLFASRGITRTAASLTFSYIIAVDPRVRPVRYCEPRLTSLLDDADHPLIDNSKIKPAENKWQYQPTNVWYGAATVPLPKTLGKKITSAQGALSLDIALSSDSLNIDKPADRLNKPITFHGRTVTIGQWPNADEGHITSENSRIDYFDGNPPGAAPPPEDNSLLLDYIDATGKIVGHATYYPNGSMGTFDSGKAPITLRLTVATKTKHLDIPFEFKNIPIP